MAKIPTRRDFLGIPPGRAAIGPTAPAAPAMPLTGRAASTHSPSGNLMAWVTDERRRISPAPPIDWTRARAGTGRDSIVLSPERKYQKILGFGAAFTDGSCYMFNQLSASARTDLFHTLFNPAEMGLNVCRTCIGSADSATTVYCYDEGGADPDLKRFSIEHDREYILPILREARGTNPDVFLFSSPWSPPGWMKSNGSHAGRMHAAYLHAVLRQLLSKVSSHLRSRGCAGAGGHRAKRGRRRSGRRHARLRVASGL